MAATPTEERKEIRLCLRTGPMSSNRWYRLRGNNTPDYSCRMNLIPCRAAFFRTPGTSRGFFRTGKTRVFRAAGLSIGYLAESLHNRMSL
jgi:hypothetical protein